MTDEQGSLSGAGHQLETPLQGEQRSPCLQLHQEHSILLRPAEAGLKHSAYCTREPDIQPLDFCNSVLLFFLTHMRMHIQLP